MAEPDSIDPANKLQIYQSLTRVNESLEIVILQCGELQNFSLLNPDQSKRYQLIAQELQAFVNHAVVDRMNAIERDDAFGYQKLRLDLEARLNPEMKKE